MEIGEKRNKLTLVGISSRNKWNHKIGLFSCDCGENKNILLANVKSGDTKSCGCVSRSLSLSVGSTVNKLTLVRIAGKTANKLLIGLFSCECGGHKEIIMRDVKRGRTKSCGCLKNVSYASTHGLSGTPEHVVWSGIKQRCNNKNSGKYMYYGGRGISICKEWADFSVFLKDMGKRPDKTFSIDRINNNGNYEPSNCVWKSRISQMNNTRGNRVVTVYGVTDTVANFARALEVPSSRIYARLVLGWSEHDAIFTQKLRSKYNEMADFQ